MTSRVFTICAARASGFMALFIAAILLVAVAGCEAPNPDSNTPTSGRLIVYVDEMYAPMIKTLADTFMVRSPNAKVEIRPAPARMAVQQMFDALARDTSKVDTSTAYAIVIGRKLLADESDAANKSGLDIKEYVLAYDGLAVVVPSGSPLRHTTREALRSGLASPSPTLSMLDSTAAGDPVRFILPDQNSSTYSTALAVLTGDSVIAAPARYFESSDSVLNSVAAGEGIGILGWVAAHRDSARLRTLPLGFVDSLGKVHPPAIVHPTSLVTGAYPLKLTVTGYTYASTRSLAVGFLAWLSKSQDAQYYMANHGLQPENVKLRIVLPEQE